jgi:hypothetical protein
MIGQQARDLVVMGMGWSAELGAGLGCAIKSVSAVRQIMIDSTGVELEVN